MHKWRKSDAYATLQLIAIALHQEPLEIVTKGEKSGLLAGCHGWIVPWDRCMHALSQYVDVCWRVSVGTKRRADRGIGRSRELIEP